MDSTYSMELGQVSSSVINDRAGIAIIGMAGRYASADSPAQLWENIINETDVFQSEAVNKENYVGHYSAVTDIDKFDNEFFKFSTFDAMITDPQHRVLLKCVKEALENAGYEQETNDIKIGVFATTSLSTYLLHNIIGSDYYKKHEINYPLIIGNDKDYLGTKIAYKLNLTGPAITIQTACSSSLVAMHYACQSLLNGKCDIAIVGGVSISVPQEKGYEYKESGILSKDGVCRSFDENANGTIKGNGCSVIVLKRFAEAAREHNTVHAVINATAVNNDGANKPGYTAPSIEGQRSVIEEALAMARLAPSNIDYIEAHGTGTALGDPIEIAALAKVYDQANKVIPLGSLKANIGHLDVASGLTSLVKAVMMLKNQTIPAIKNFNQESSAIRAISHPFYFPKKHTKKEISHIAVSSFGLGGTNAHAIVSHSPGSNESTRKTLPCYLVPLYFNKEQDLAEYKASIYTTLETYIHFEDFVYSMSVGKKRRSKVYYLVAKDKDEFKRLLDSLSLQSDNVLPLLPNFSSLEMMVLREWLPSFNLISAENDVQENCILIECLSKLNAISDQDKNFQSHNTLVKNSLNQTIQDPYQVLFKLLDYLGRFNIQNEINFTLLYAHLQWKRGPLPQYPLNEKRFWIDEVRHSTDLKCEKNISIAMTTLGFIMACWRETIGSPHVTPETDYFNIGGDSLTAIDILDKINNQYSIRISLNEFMQNLTPLQQSQLVENITNKKIISCISQIRNSSRDKHIFLIHPAGGTTFCYHTLNRFLKGDFNLYGIDLPTNYSEFSSLESLAHYYLIEIKKIQPIGPYSLGGYSFGGNLAYELAFQFEQNSDVVEKVIMFDSHPPSAYTHANGKHINYDEAFPWIISSYFSEGNAHQFSPQHFQNLSVKESLKLLRQYLAINLADEQIVQFYSRWINNHQWLKHYQKTHSINSELILFVGEEAEDISILNLLNIKSMSKESWCKYFLGMTQLIMIPGNHYSLFGKEENVKKLAEKLNEVMVN